MTATDPISVAPVPSSGACPACSAAPAAQVQAQQSAAPRVNRLMLSVPSVHCAGCISTVERTLLAQPGVRDARVNLTLKRAIVHGEPDLPIDPLIAALEGAGHEAHELDPDVLSVTDADRTGRDLLMRVGVAGFASMNVMLLSVAVWSGAENATRDLFHWISAAIALPAIAFSAQPFFRNAWSALRNGRMNMDVPIVLAILLAAGTSLYETAMGGEHAYFDAALMLTFFLLAGRYLDHRTRSAARSAAESLAALEVPRAERLTEDGTEEVALSAVSVGDHLRIKPGARMPVDGVVVSGESEIDRSLLTGETLPIYAGPGQKVSAGEVNLTGPLEVQTTAVGRDSSLHALADLVAVAESGRSKYSSLADKAARLYAPGVHILAALSFAGWFVYTRDMRTSINIAAAVLIITCPCALGLAVPAVTTAASGRLFRKGLLIKDATALERLAEADTVVFDKTGTLTEGVPQPLDLTAYTPRELSVVRALAQGSAHPLAQALDDAVTVLDIAPADVTDLHEVPGFGIAAQWDGQPVRLGRADWLGAEDLGSDNPSTWLQIGASTAPHAFYFADNLRPGVARCVSDLKAQGLGVKLLSGDTDAAVSALAQRVGIDDWAARMSPQDKAAEVQKLTASGHKVLMVGDGLNDTAALVAAHVSVSPASALDAARVASDIVLLGRDLSALSEARETAQYARRRIRQNFRIATAYNVVAVPLAVAGLATPLIAALAMSLSSITVSLNALRLGPRTRRDAPIDAPTAATPAE